MCACTAPTSPIHFVTISVFKLCRLPPLHYGPWHLCLLQGYRVKLENTENPPFLKKRGGSAEKVVWSESSLSFFFFFFFSREFMARVPSTRRNENSSADAYKNRFCVSWVSIRVCKHTFPHMGWLNFQELINMADFLVKVIFLTSDTAWKLEVFDLK